MIYLKIKIYNSCTHNRLYLRITSMGSASVKQVRIFSLLRVTGVKQKDQNSLQNS